VLNPDAGQFHAPITKAAQEQRTRRIKVGQLANIEDTGLALRPPLLHGSFGLGERPDIECALKRHPIPIIIDGDRQRDWLRGCLLHG
jgi:hypothetical protein